jgi:hypothetical protein
MACTAGRARLPARPTPPAWCAIPPFGAVVRADGQARRGMPPAGIPTTMRRTTCFPRSPAIPSEDRCPRPAPATASARHRPHLIDIRPSTSAGPRAYKLTYGWASPFYIDCRRSFLSRGTAPIIAMASKSWRDGGLAERRTWWPARDGRIPYAAWISGGGLSTACSYVRRSQGFRRVPDRGRLKEAAGFAGRGPGDRRRQQLNFVNGCARPAARQRPFEVFFYGVFAGAEADLARRGFACTTWRPGRMCGRGEAGGDFRRIDSPGCARSWPIPRLVGAAAAGRAKTAEAPTCPPEGGRERSVRHSFLLLPLDGGGRVGGESAIALAF